MEVPEQRYHVWKSVQLLIRMVIRRFDHGVLLIIRPQSGGRGLELLLITRGAELRRVFCSVATRYPDTAAFVVEVVRHEARLLIGLVLPNVTPRAK
jgi:hypothetical protein